jgi:hypothetical protein
MNRASFRRFTWAALLLAASTALAQPGSSAKNVSAKRTDLLLAALALQPGGRVVFVGY